MVMISDFYQIEYNEESKDKQLSYYIEMFLEEKRRDSKETFKTYYNTLQMMSLNLFDVGLFSLTRHDIETLTWQKLEKYKSELIKKNSNNTVTNRISAIKAFIKYLKARNAIDYNTHELSLISSLNDDGETTEMIPLETLIEYVEYFEQNEQRKGLEKKLVCLLALETGNRVQDLLSIKKSQLVPYEDDYVLKSKGKNKGKGNKDYVKGLGKELYAELIKLNPESEKVFSISYRSLLDALKRANEHFGNQEANYTPHSIKHLAVTLEYRETGDILLAQLKGDHESVETTRRYLKVETTPRVGAYTRMISTKQDNYKEAKLDELVSVIDTLPMDVRLLINRKLEELNK